MNRRHLFPLVYQLDARLLLAQHPRKIDRAITLAEIPEAELKMEQLSLRRRLADGGVANR